MNTQKLFVKIVYCLAGLLILASIGFNIYQYKRNKELFAKSAPDKIENNESSISESKSISNSPSVIAAQKTIVTESKKENPGSGDINELEGNLNSTEKELDRTSEELSKELSQKNNFKKAYEQFSKNMTSNPAFQKTINDSVNKSILKAYDPLFKKLNISKEEFEEFKGILADRMMEIQNVVPSNIVTASDEEKAEMNQKISDINNKYRDRVNDFLGEENSKIYVSYQQSLSERSSLSYFMETVPPDNRISEEQREALIDNMYAARKAVYDETGPDIDLDSSVNLTEENINRYIDKRKMVYDKYVEASRGVLPDDQAEQYRAYLERNLGTTESSLKTRLFMNGDK